MLPFSVEFLSTRVQFHEGMQKVNPMRRWIIAGFAALLITLMAGGVTFYRMHERRQWAGAIANLQSVAELKVSQIIEWREEHLADAAAVTEAGFIREVLVRWMTNPKPEAAEPIMAWFRVLQRYHKLRDILLVDPEGRTLLSLSGTTTPLHAEARLALEAALREQRPVLTDLHAGPGDLPPHVETVAPISSEDGQRSAILGAIIHRCDARQFLYPMIQSWPTPSKSAETLLVRRDGDGVLFLNDLRHRQGAGLRLRVPLSQKEVPAVQAVLGREAVMEGKDYRGEEVLSVLKAIPGSPWFLVAKIDRGELLADWRLVSALIVALIMVVVGTLAALMGMGWQRHEKVHYQALFESEADRRKDQERLGLAYEAAKAGAWEWDLQSNENFWSDELWKVYGLEPQSCRPSYEAWRQTIHPDDRAGVERVVQQAALHGRELAAEWRVRDADGRQRWLMSRGRPRRDAGGAVTHYVGVVMDITERKRAELALADLARSYGARVNELGCLFGISALVEKPGNSIEDILQGTADLIPTAMQYSEVACARITLEDREFRTRNFQETTCMQSSPITVHGDPSGAVEVCYLQEKPDRDDGPFLKEERNLINAVAQRLGSFVERRRAEAALRKSEARFRLLSDTASRLLASNDSHGIAHDLLRQVMEHVGCETFFHFLQDHETGRLRLHAYTGIPEEQAGALHWLDYGGADAARADHGSKGVIAGELLSPPDLGEDRLRPLGIRAYACHPLLFQGRLAATVSFGSRTRADFSSEDLSLMKAVAGQFAGALERTRLIEELRRSRDELEVRVRERTAELSRAVQSLEAEISRRERVEETLRESEKQVRLFASQCLTAQEEERKRIARDLHDSIAGSLVAVRLIIERAQDAIQDEASSRDSLDDAISAVARAVRDLRRIMADLRPSVLDDLGIVAALGWLCREFQRTYPSIRIELAIGLSEDEVPASLKTVTFRLAQEALNNIAKHSKATLVKLSLKNSTAGVELTIQDNGQGFDPGKEFVGRGAGHALGLPGMRERAQLSGGDFSVESSEGAGTTVRVAWPSAGR
jgi:PAS domain S-box-containing protein